MRHLFTIIATFVLLVCVCNARAEDEIESRIEPVIIAVQLEVDICTFSREVIVLQELYGYGAVLFYQPGYADFIVASSEQEIITNLYKVGLCEELTNQYMQPNEIGL